MVLSEWQYHAMRVQIMLCIRDKFEGYAPSIDRVVDYLVRHTPWSNKPLIARFNELERYGLIKITRNPLGFPHSIQLLIPTTTSDDSIHQLLKRGGIYKQEY